jgi:ketosteroid isomerase-like protein
MQFFFVPCHTVFQPCVLFGIPYQKLYLKTKAVILAHRHCFHFRIGANDDFRLVFLAIVNKCSQHPAFQQHTINHTCIHFHLFIAVTTGHSAFVYIFYVNFSIIQPFSPLARFFFAFEQVYQVGITAGLGYYLQTFFEQGAASNAIYHQSTAKNDSTIFLNSYTEDACVLPPNAPMICGRDALAKFFRAGYDMGIRGGNFTTTNVYGSGDGFVTEEGIGQVLDTSGKVYDDFKYLVLWKETKDGWKMYRDAFSSNLPKNKRMNRFEKLPIISKTFCFLLNCVSLYAQNAAWRLPIANEKNFSPTKKVLLVMLQL